VAEILAGVSNVYCDSYSSTQSQSKCTGSYKTYTHPSYQKRTVIALRRVWIYARSHLTTYLWYVCTDVKHANRTGYTI